MSEEASGLGRGWFRSVLAILVLVVAGIIAFGCGGDDDDDDGDSGGDEAAQTVEPFTITFPFQDSIIWSGYEISRGPDGPFQVDAGLEPETEAAEGNSATIQQLISGRVDYAVSGAPEIMVAQARGHDIVGLSSYYDDVFTIVSTTDSGVESIEDLEGKSLGVTDLGGGEIPLVNAALNAAGLEPDKDVKLEVVGPGGATAFRALRDGDVAGFGGAINDLVPLESQGLNFQVILPDEFTNLPSDYLAVRREVLDDSELMDTLTAFQKAWFTGVIYGEQYPEAGLDRICEQVPEDCQDPEFAQGFYESAIGISIDEAREGGCPRYDRLTTVRDAVAAVDNPGASDINPEDVFPDDYCEDMVPSEDDVQAFAERTGVANGGE